MGKKNRKQKGNDFWDFEEDEKDVADPLKANGVEEPEPEAESAPQAALQKKKKNKKKSKGKEANVDSDDDVIDPLKAAPVAGEDEEDEESIVEITSPKGTNKKKKGDDEGDAEEMAVDDEEVSKASPRKARNKSKKKAVSFAALGLLEDEEGNEESVDSPDDEEDEAEAVSASQKTGSASLQSEEDEEQDDSIMDSGAPTEERKPQSKKAKKKKKPPAFSLLLDEDDLGIDEDANGVDEQDTKPAEGNEEDLDEEEEQAVESKEKTKKKKKKSLSSFSDLSNFDDDEPSEDANNSTQSEEEPVLDENQTKSKKKKKKLSAISEILDADDSVDSALTKKKKKKSIGDKLSDIILADGDPESPIKSSSKKKSKKKKEESSEIPSPYPDLEGDYYVCEILSVRPHPKADRLKILVVDIGDDKELEIVCGATNVRTGLKSVVATDGAQLRSTGDLIKNTKVRGVVSYGMMCGALEVGWKDYEDREDQVLELGDHVEAGRRVSEDSKEFSETAKEDPKPSSKSKKKQKKKKESRAQDPEEDIDAILMELDGHSATQTSQEDSKIPTTEGSQALKSSKKKKKGKAKESAAADDDIDAILAELDGPREAAETEAPEVASVPDASAEELPQPLADDDAAQPEKELTSAQKKRLKKKQKEQEKAKSGEKTEKDGSKKSGKAVPKHVLEMQQRLAKIKEEEERKKREEEERRKKEEEEERLENERLKLEEEKRRLRKEKERARKELRRKEGKAITAKEREEERKAAAFREQMLAEKGFTIESIQSQKKKVVYDNRKKKKSTPKPVEEHETNETNGNLESTQEEAKLDEKVEEEASESVQIQDTKEESEDEDQTSDWDNEDWESSNIIVKIPSSTLDDEEIPDAKKVVIKRVKSAELNAMDVKDGLEKDNEEEGDDNDSEEEDNTESESEDSEADGSDSDTESSSEYDSSDSDSSSDEESEDSEDEKYNRIMEARERRLEREALAMAARSKENLRSPICCILGHVDTGKTKILDRIRNTNVQDGEAGGITQQIGATFLPIDAVQKRIEAMDEAKEDIYNVPGMLVIDTPGHESFTNLRSRGTGLCDMAILVIDIMHGLEPQTIESINLLKMRKTPFIVALNKIDRLYGWKESKDAHTRLTLSKQKQSTVNEFEERWSKAKLALNEQGLNAALYWENPDIRKFINVVPTSAITGEGMSDLLLLVIQLTQKMLIERLMYSSALSCTVLEVKASEGLGTTIDVILIRGELHEGDTIVLCGMNGPIVTQIRALLTPHPMKEIRLKGSYEHHKSIKGAQGIKIAAQNLENTVAGTQMFVLGAEDNLEELEDEVMKDMSDILKSVDKSEDGVCVQASTLGSMEALLEFLKSPAVKIPVSGIALGPIHKKDILKASTMAERGKKEYAVILAFDVVVSKEAEQIAKENGVTIFRADIIYHLFDMFTDYMSKLREEKRSAAAEEASFPVIMQIVPKCVFNKKDPIVVGVDIVEGVARLGTPICAKHGDEFVDIGRISSMEVNHKVVSKAYKGESVAVKIQGSTTSELQKVVGRHFDETDTLYSKMSRRTIDILKENYRNDLSKEEWKLVVYLKKVFDIQ